MRSVGVRSPSKTRGGGRAKSSTRGEPRGKREAPAAKTRPAKTGGITRFLRGKSDGKGMQRPMLLLTALLIVGGGLAGLYHGGYFDAAEAGIVRQFGDGLIGAGFAVKTVALTGNERTSEKAISEALGLGVGDTIVAFDPAKARAALMKLPWVSDAVVRRRFPDRIAVTLFEKRPFALWQNGKTVEVVERSGAIIAGVGTETLPKLPLLAGTGAPEAAAPLLDALGGYRAISARLKGAERISERRWDLVLDRGIRVRLPEEGWEAQLADLEMLIVDKGVLERDVEIIDLRFPDSYIFQLHNGDSRPAPRDRPA